MEHLPDDIIVSLPQYLNCLDIYLARYVSRFWYRQYLDRIKIWYKDIESWMTAIQRGDIHLLSLLINAGKPPVDYYYNKYLWILMEAHKCESIRVISYLAPILKDMRFKGEDCRYHSVLYTLGMTMLNFVSKYPEYFEMSHGFEIRCNGLYPVDILELWLYNENMGDVMDRYINEILKVVMMMRILGYINMRALIYLRQGPWRAQIQYRDLVLRIDRMIDGWNVK